MTHIRPYAASDRLAVEQLNVTYYTTTHSFDGTFAQAVSGALDSLAPRAKGWVVTHQDAVAGSLFLSVESPGTGRLRLFLLRPDLHGKGLARPLLGRALAAAPALGLTRLTVSTFTIHAAACALYARAGFTESARRPCAAFGHALTQLDFLRIAPA